MDPKTLIFGKECFKRIVELHSAKLMVVSILAKGKVNHLCEMDIDFTRRTQESRHAHGALLTWEEGSNQSQIVCEKRGAFGEPLNTAMGSGSQMDWEEQPQQNSPWL